MTICIEAGVKKMYDIYKKIILHHNPSRFQFELVMKTNISYSLLFKILKNLALLSKLLEQLEIGLLLFYMPI